MNDSIKCPAPIIQSDWRPLILVAYFIILTAFGGGAGWATFSKLNSAAIAPGVVMAQSNKKTVQHFEGGIVRDILVRDGDQVEEGQVLVRLDDTQARASLDTIRSQLAIARIQEARLLAERTQTSRIVFPEYVNSRRTETQIEKAIEDQEASLRDRATYLRSQTDVLNAKILQTDQEIRALKNDAESAKHQLETVDMELKGVRQLFIKQLVSVTRVAALERERIRLQGVVDRATSDAQKGFRSIEETRFAIIQLQKQFMQQVSADIIDVRKNIAELSEKENVAKDISNRVDVRAPRTGIVQALKIFTLGAVVRPGDTLLEIAPTGDQLTVNVQISPSDIDSVTEGLRAEVRFPTYHSRRVPIMLGYVRTVSYDRVNDPQNPQNSYFQAEIAVNNTTIPNEIRDKLKPGMPADVIVTTGEQSPIDYFLGPLFDRVGHGLREK